MIPILHKTASGRVWVVVTLVVAALFFALYGGLEGVSARDGSRGAGGGANQSAGDIVVHGPSELSVRENTAIGTSIAFYRVVTPTGADVSGEVYSFSLEGEDAGKYRIDSRSGELFTAAWLDYETDVSDTFLVYASSDTTGVGLDVRVSIENVEDSVSTISISKANPVPGVGRGNPEHALDEPYAGNFVETEWANWGTILRIEVRSESPDPDCGTGLDCVHISLESDAFNDEQELIAMRSGAEGIRYLAAVKLVDSEAENGETVEIIGADGISRSVELLQVSDEDEVSIEFGNLRGSVDVENEPPEFHYFWPEYGSTFDHEEVDFVFVVTDVYSGLPEPEDLPDNDGDGDYTPVVALLHDSQCYSNPQAGENLEVVENLRLHDDAIYCDGQPEFRPIVDDKDFDETDNGYEVETTIVLPEDETSYVTFIACDNAGNCTAYDPDEDSDIALLQIGPLIDEDLCLVPIAGDITISGTWDGTCPSGRAPEPYGGDGDRYARYYTFSLDSTSDVTISLTSEEDTYLYLLEGAGRSGTELYENDDVVPSEDLNSRIEANLGQGQYTIEATTYYSQKTGGFTLELSGIGGAAPVDADCSSGIAVNDPEENGGLVFDCEALLAARDKLAGAASLNWSADVPIEGWDGVTIDGSPERVDEIDLGGFELSGEIPAEIGELSVLRELHLDYNLLRGGIPAELGELTSLSLLAMQGNDLSGEIPSELGSLLNLTLLALHDNQLQGEIPLEITNLHKLEFLSLGRNSLIGEIPPGIANLDRLTTLHLDFNQLSGEIPPELGGLARLESLFLQQNQFKGTVPPGLGNLENLDDLYLAGNDLSGCLPDGLRDVRNNDFAELGLFYCGETIGPTPTPTPPTSPCVSSLGDFESRLEIIDDHWDDWCGSVNRPDSADTYARFFTFNLTVEADVTITLESEEDAYLYLMRGDVERGVVLYEDDDTEGTDSFIRTTLRPGSYTVEATTYEIGVTGDFRIQIELDALDGRPPVTCITDIVRVHSHSSYIYPDSIEGDCKSVSRPTNGEYYARYFSLPLKFPAEVTITLTSKEDPYLLLLKGERVTGTVLYENDDAEGTNSQIEAILEPGIYTIEATTYEEGVTGEFELEVFVVSTSRELCSNGRAVSDPDNNIALLIDCSSLLDMKYSLLAEPPLNWSADLPMEEWEGVTLGGEPLRVTELRLVERGLAGRVSGDFDNLVGVQRLILTGNSLTGTMPWPGGKESLDVLELGSNRFGGAMHRPWGGFTNLEVLAVYDNKLEGEIPWQLGDLENLSALVLSGNRLEGKIPRTLGKLKNLDKMHLSDNRLEGQIPVELADIPNLYGLFLSGNDLSGCIPDGLRDVHENDFDELGLPFCPPPSVDDCVEPLPAVSAITIRDTWYTDCPSVNSPTGDPYYARYYTFSVTERTPIEIELTAEDGGGSYIFLLEGEGSGGRILHKDGRDYGSTVIATTLEPGDYTIEASTYYAEITGDFELEVRMLQDATAQCTRGVAVPLPDDNASLVEKCVALLQVGFWLDAETPLNWKSDRPIYEWEGLTFEDTIGALTALELPNRGLRGVLPPELGSFTKLQVLDLQQNSLEGEIPPELGNLIELEELKVSINRISGSIPPQLGDLENLRNLSLAINLLSGGIPPELGRLSNLEILWLAGCGRLSGTIPEELADLSNLRVLDVAGNVLTGEIPSVLGNLANLERLGLGGNRLHGSIPVELANLTSLRDLYLYVNELSGNIPNELSRLQNLKDLQLYRNNLTGGIPSELGEIAGLEHLILSFNELEGEIPSELGNIHDLRELDLEENLLTGEIPKSLANLQHLEYSDFRRNELTGCIPYGMKGIVETDPVLPVCSAP